MGACPRLAAALYARCLTQSALGRRAAGVGRNLVSRPSPDNARSESVLAVNPLNDLNMVGASKRFTDPAKYGFTLAAYATFDGGTTWTEAALALPASWGGITDPAVGWDDAGNVYLAPQPHPSRAGRQASTRKRVLRACICLTGGKEPPPVLRPF